MDKLVVFTEWGTVILNGEHEINLTDFFQRLEKYLKTPNYNVIYMENTNEFYITFMGTEYKVVLLEKDKKSLQDKTYSPVILKLMLLATKEKEINDAESIERLKNKKIKTIEESFYDDIETKNDWQLYLEFLRDKLKKTRNKEEKNVLNKKITNIEQIIINLKENEGLNNQNAFSKYIYGFIYDLIEKAKKLNSHNKQLIIEKIRRLAINYKNTLDQNESKKANGLIVGNSDIPMDILDQIIIIELELKRMLKQDDITSLIEQETRNISNELDEIIKGENK